ncbi:MAG TPA: T9SS type A sorting domain-containing protein [Mucilaginibacter sp.]|jgi:hypothetical protein|nr:T9SS type A sorting domain-containing protein [Mucilaginibacter sp.]
MKTRLLSILIFCGSILSFGNAFATISYASPQTYTAHTAITNLSPTVTGGTASGYTISPALPTGLAIASSNGVISGTPTVASSTTVYTITATGTGGGSFNLTITVNPRINNWKGTATGASLNAWSANGNWSAGAPPDGGDNAQIGVAVSFTNQPIIKAAPTAVYQLTFGSTTAGTLTINSGFSLTVNNDIAINGATTAAIVGPGTIATAAASFASGTASTLTLNNIALPITNDLTINGGASATIVKSGTGTISAGTSTFTTGTSSLTLTGIALPITGALTVNGGALATITGTGTISAGSATFASGATSSLTLTGVALPVTNAFTVSGGAAATLTGTGSITAGSAAFTSGTSSLALNMALPVTNALTINAGALATVTGTGSIAAGSATFGTGTAASLTLTGVSLTVSNALSIVAGASATLAGTGSVSTHSLTFAGASAALTVTSPLTITTTNDFTVNTAATATIAGTGNVNISPLATLNVTGTGVLTTTMTGKLTLKSDATGSASVGQITTSSITGSGADSIHVERFISGGTGHRGYHLFSSPVHIVPLVNSNQVYDLHYLQYGGMYLTGSGGTANGFDRLGNPTIYLYREDQAPSNAAFSAGNFPGISKINNTNKYDYNLNGGSTIYNIPVGNGMMVFFRGNRAGGTAQQETYTTFITAPTVTLNAAGRLNAGQIIFHNWYKPSSANLGWSNTTANSAIRGFNLVGNPYASTIDWEQFQTASTTTGIYGTANVSNTAYLYDPISHVYSTYQKGGAKTGNATRYIASGQGFYVLAAVDSTEQLIFNESAKVTVQNTGSNLFMSTRASMSALAAPAPEAHVSIKLIKDSVNIDNIYIGFNAAASAKYVFNEDAPYKPGFGVISLASLSSDNLPLTINKIPFPKLHGDTISLKVGVSTTGTYAFNMSEVISMPAIYEVWLKDAFTNDSLDVRQNAVYSFNVDINNGATFGSGRFKLIVRENPALVVHLLSFTGTKAITGAQINWTTENEQDYTSFTVERSTDNGITFTSLNNVASSSQGSYGFLDTNPLLGVDMYRLKITDLNGTVTYSNVVSLTYTTSPVVINNPLKVYPNPVANTLNLTITPSSSTASVASAVSNGLVSSGGAAQIPQVEEYRVTIVNNSGTVLKKAVSNKTTWQADVSNFLPGSYVIQVSGKSGKALGQCVFIKL